MTKELIAKITKVKHNIQLSLLGLFVVILAYLMFGVNTSVWSMIALVLVMFAGQVLHEYLHSLASRITVRDWGKVYFGITKGFFYTSKVMNFKEFAIITSAPFIIMTSILAVIWLIYGRFILWGSVDIALVVMAVYGACVSDIANVITQFIFRHRVPVIIISKPR